MKTLICALLVLVAAACTVPVVTLPPPISSPSPTDVPTPTLTPLPSATPLPTATFTATLTADTLILGYPETITVTPWTTDTASRLIQCLLAHYEFTWLPGKIIVFRRDKAGYFNCIKGD